MSQPQKLMAKKAPVEFTLELKQKFLEYYRQNGLKNLSAEMVGVVPETVYQHQKRDPIFNELCVAAKEAHTDEMIQEAQRRALQGVSEPIIGGKNRDQIVTHVQRYSDRLLELLLKANRDEFRNNVNVNAEVSGGVLVVPAGGGNSGKPLSAEEWEKQYGAASAGLESKPSTPSLGQTPVVDNSGKTEVKRGD